MSFSQGRLAAAVLLAHGMPAPNKAKIEGVMGTGQPQTTAASSSTKCYSCGPWETNDQFTSQQLALAVSLHNSPWLSLALRMRSYREGDNGEDLWKDSSKTLCQGAGEDPGVVGSRQLSLRGK